MSSSLPGMGYSVKA